MSAGLIKTYEFPPGDGTQFFAEMAATHGLHVVELLPTEITVEGPEADQEVFGDRLASLVRLCRPARRA
jgi:hypothetical protein